VKKPGDLAGLFLLMLSTRDNLPTVNRPKHQEPADDRGRSTDLGMTIFLGVMLLNLFVVFPLVESGLLGRIAISFGLTTILITGVFGLARHHGLRRVGIGFAAIALVAEWFCNLLSSQLRVTGLVTGLVYLGFLTVAVLFQVVRPGRITRHRIRGALAVYLLLGLVWAMAYSLVDILVPGSFELPETMRESTLDPQERRLPSMIYFSFVTLSTVGYGDIVPLSVPARSLAVIEALVGPLYLAILVARLVSLEIVGATTNKRPGD
jgi:hypothetical protein